MHIPSLFQGLIFNKKLLLGTTIPAASSIAVFGSTSQTPEYKIMVNYNGQADLLLSLQIPPDYYPYQFKKTNLYDYLTNTNKYLVQNEHTSDSKRRIKEGIQKKISELLGKVKEFGPSLWNEDLYDTGIVFRNNQFWNSKKTDLLLIEQFISDDYSNIQEAYDLLPAHKTLLTTNYRVARDPYTIFSKDVYDCFKDLSGSQPIPAAAKAGGDAQTKASDHKICGNFKKYIEEYNKTDINSLYRSGKFIQYWNGLISKNKDLEQLLKDEKLFSLSDTEDKVLADKYAKTIFTEEEIKTIKEWMKEAGGDGNGSGGGQGKSPKDDDWNLHYLTKGVKPSKAHHPALEQQILPGTAPLSEGSQKDIVVFLYQVASLLDSYVTDKSNNFATSFANDYRKEALKNVMNNAKCMAKNIEERIEKIRDYFKAIKVVDSSFDPKQKNYTNTNSKTFTVLTYPPSSFGAGEATIQSISKFPFIYSDIGLKQPMPNNLTEDHSNHQHEDLSHELFSVDDNGWWWKIGSVVLDASGLLSFRNNTDTLLILANEDDWNLLQDSSSGILAATSALLKDHDAFDIDMSKVQGNEAKFRNNKGYPVSYNKYHLWNEGLRSPIAMNLLLDNLVDIFQRQYDSNFNADSKDKYKEAMDWGDYWDKHFIEGSHASSENTSKPND